VDGGFSRPQRREEQTAGGRRAGGNEQVFHRGGSWEVDVRGWEPN
jgi:hypothetical protein